MKVRPTISADIPALQRVLKGTDLFPAEMLPDMFGNTEAHDLWLTCVRDDEPVGFCYTVPEQLAEGAWNMLAIAVLPVCQGSGAGRLLTRALEARLRESGQRIVLADTSGTDEFKRTRAFYRGNGYEEEARIRDFWAEGDDKVTFRKAL